jgi:hypothetical protein
MSAKFLLALIAVNGLCLSANAAVATTELPPATTHHITQLSQTIANLIDIDDRNLVELAINRALLAQKVNEVKVPTLQPMVTAGVPRLPTQTEKQSNADDDKKVIPDNILPVGLIAIPKDGSSESTTTDTKQPNSDDKKASPGNRIRVGLINNGGNGASKSTPTDNKQSNSDDPKVDPNYISPIGYILKPQDGSTKSTTTNDKQPTVRGRTPIKLPEIGRFTKPKEPSIGQMKTSESENPHNSSTTVDPKIAR